MVCWMSSKPLRPDGRYVLAGSADKAIHVWDLEQDVELPILKDDSGRKTALAVSPDGRWVLSGCDDQIVKLWDFRSRKVVREYEGNQQYASIVNVGFLKDGLHDYSCGTDSAVIIWPLPGSGSAPAISTPQDTPPPVVVTPPINQDPPPIVKRKDYREPVPDAAAIAAAEKQVREQYSGEYANRYVGSVRRFYSQLSMDGNNTQGNPALRYAFFSESRDQALRIGDVWHALSASESLGRFFALDGWDLKADVFEQIEGITFHLPESKDPKAALKEHQRKLAAEALAGSDTAVEHDSLAAAERLTKAGQSWANKARDKAMLDTIPVRLKELAALRKSYEPVPQALKTLDAQFLDPSANLIVGKYYAMGKGDWNRALPKLVLGSDSKLKDLAQSDVNCKFEAEAMAELAKRYQDLAEGEKDDAQTHILWRACYWYERAEGLSKGPEKTKIAAVRLAIEKNLPPSRPYILYASQSSATSNAWLTNIFQRQLAKSGGLKVIIPKNQPNSGFPPLLPGEQMEFIVGYRYRGRVRLITTFDFEKANLLAPENNIDLHPGKPAPGQELTILLAEFGNPRGYRDITDKVQSQVKGARIQASLNDLGIPKTANCKEILIPVYLYQGEAYFSFVPVHDQPILDRIPMVH
jgi:hypothetical protein